MNATTKKKSFYAKYIQPHMGLSILITIIGGGIMYYLEMEKDKLEHDAKDALIEQRIYKTPAQYQKAIDHDNEVPSDVENFKRELRLIEQGDIQIVQQMVLDSQQVHIRKSIMVIDSFFQYAKRKNISDSIGEIKKQESRDARTAEIQNIGNILRALQKDIKDN